MIVLFLVFSWSFIIDLHKISWTHSLLQMFRSFQLPLVVFAQVLSDGEENVEELKKSSVYINTF